MYPFTAFWAPLSFALAMVDLEIKFVVSYSPYSTQRDDKAATDERGKHTHTMMVASKALLNVQASKTLVLKLR